MKVSGFSKKSKSEKINWIVDAFFNGQEEARERLRHFWMNDQAMQDILDGFSENTISNYILPYGVAPNFIINGRDYCVPMVIEESSVVAAAAAAAKYWSTRGGFKTTIIGTQKVGQLHFTWNGNFEFLKRHEADIKKYLLEATKDMTTNMVNRGGGIIDIELLDFSQHIDDYYQIRTTFETCDSMGANFINSILESFGDALQNYIIQHPVLPEDEKDIDVVMAILSNYTPDCMVRAEVSCPIEDLGVFSGGMDAHTFAKKFYTAVKIAEVDAYRATTHNKGIYNGVDAVVLATGNDFRAIEACGHTHAAQGANYSSLSHCELKDGVFRFWLDLPLAVGTVGGLTALHPLAKLSLQMLGQPSACELMEIIAAVGLAQNFAALRSLTTTGIQHGHMKMHLKNILIQLDANDDQIKKAFDYFEDKTVSYSAVRAFLEG